MSATASARAVCAVFIATSLDGFISRPDGSIDWLLHANTLVPEGEDCGYAAFMQSVDALVMGRNTFEQVLGFPEWPYEGRKVVVMSRSGVPVPPSLAGKVEVSALSPADLVARLSAEGARRLYIDGGQTIRSFLAAGLIDELTITLIPVLAGEGRPFCGEGMSEVWLSHEGTQTWSFGFVQNRYRVNGPGSPATCR